MIDSLFLFLLPPIAGLLIALIPLAVIPRMRMERRAKGLLGAMPQHERKTVYLRFASGWYRGKGKEMEAKIVEKQEAGWTFLKTSEANPLKTLLTWDGGVNLHFIRKV